MTCVSVGGSVVVEVSRDEGQENANLLVRSGGDGEELVEDLGLLDAVRVLASTGLEDLSEGLVDSLGRDGNWLALVADRLEPVVLLVDIDGHGSRLLGLLGCGGVLGLGLLISSAEECFRVSLVASVGVLVLSLGLAELLLHGVEGLGVERVHLLLARLGRSEEVLDRDQSPDEGGRDGLTDVGLAGDELCELVELCRDGGPVVDLSGVVDRLGRGLDLLCALALC